MWQMRNGRDDHLREWMDDPDCDPKRLENTYLQFSRINRWFAGWRHIYRRHIRPLGSPLRLLDVGCGGGDIACKLLEWAAADSFSLQITAIDSDTRAIAFFRQRLQDHRPDTLTVREGELAELQDTAFDVVVSNHVLHHIAASEFVPFCEATASLATRRVIHSDLRRSPLSYAGFSLLRPLFPTSFIVPDGLRSLRRSYTSAELRQKLPAWHVVPRPFGHQLLILEKDGRG